MAQTDGADSGLRMVALIEAPVDKMDISVKIIDFVHKNERTLLILMVQFST